MKFKSLMCFFIAIISVVLLAGCAGEGFNGDYAPVASENGEPYDNNEPTGDDEYKPNVSTPQITYHDKLNFETKQKVDETIGIFLNAFNRDDKETLRTITTEEFFNDMTEFKKNYPTEEEMAEAIAREMENFYDNLPDILPGRRFDFMGLIGTMGITSSEFSSHFHYIAVVTDLPQDEWPVANPSWIGITFNLFTTCNFLGMYPVLNDYEEIIGYSVTVGITLVSDEREGFLVSDFGPTYT
jgi:hypothetical protein